MLITFDIDKQKDIANLGSKGKNKLIASSTNPVSLKSCKVIFGNAFYTEMIFWPLTSLRLKCIALSSVK